MATRFLADSTTQARLGAEVLAELRATLWAVDCQTCGRPLGRWAKPALVVQAIGSVADASLHHRGCRPPGWLDYPAAGQFTAFPHVSWWAKLLLLTDDTVVFLVNPYYEYAVLHWDGGSWTVATLDRFATYGMGQNLFDGVFTQPSLSIVVDENQISAHITHDGAVRHAWQLGGDSFPPYVHKLLAPKEWLTIVVTTSLDLRESLQGNNPLPGLIAARQARIGAARITYTERAQSLRATDVDEEGRIKFTAFARAAIRLKSGIEVEENVPTAAIACGYGDNSLITRLLGKDKLAAVLMLVVPYAVRAQTHPPAPGGGIHVMAPDPAEYFGVFSEALTDLTDLTVVCLATEPTAEQRKMEYLADIVVGTPEQFRAAYAFYRDDADDWGLHQSRGHLAIAVGEEARRRAGDVIDRYPRVAVV